MAEAEAPAGKSRYSLSQLVEQCDMNAPLSYEDREWLDAPEMGCEAL
jgi:antitoxin ChpS